MAEPDLSRLRIQRSDSQVSTGARRKRRIWRWILLALFVLGAACAAYFYRLAVQVEIGTAANVYPSQAYTVLNATGYVVAQRKAAVASKATGRLEWLGVREGSKVAAGEVLARLENRDVTAQMQQAAANIKVAEASLEQGQAELQDAERQLQRSAELLQKNFVSAAAHDAVVARHARAVAAISGQRAAIAAARANYRAAQVTVDQTLIRAPFDGIVLTKNANVGDVITPFSSALGSQAAVVTMADMSTLEVEADVSEANIGKVTLGQACEIQLDALPQARFRGEVHRLVPTVDRAKATVTVKIRFIDTDPRVLPEMSAKVAFLSQQIPKDEKAAQIAVPASAVVERNGRKVVYVVHDGKAREVVVQAGAATGELIRVSGVNAGDKVVLKPSERVRNGASVTTASK
ncbi:MAG TPA: efflux RND transporter periplasmic adaptor subunit [Burkholderiales bacterium]|nr:efflux RND transporter periplasmic adaptor subunit [Burkholderiales bacterium]